MQFIQKLLLKLFLGFVLLIYTHIEGSNAIIIGASVFFFNSIVLQDEAEIIYKSSYFSCFNLYYMNFKKFKIVM